MKELTKPALRLSGGLGSFYEIAFLKTRKASTNLKKEVTEAVNAARTGHISTISVET